MLSRPEESIKHLQGLGMGREGSPSMAPRQAKDVLGWLVSTSARLPENVQTAAEINEVLHRPPGWLESHAGIRQRRVWTHQDPVAAACEAARECLSLPIYPELTDGQIERIAATLATALSR